MNVGSFKLKKPFEFLQLKGKFAQHISSKFAEDSVQEEQRKIYSREWVMGQNGKTNLIVNIRDPRT